MNDIATTHHPSTQATMSKHLTAESEMKGDLVTAHREDLEYNANENVPKSVNALAGIPKDALLQNVDAFTRQHELEDYADVFRRGALVAQKPRGFETLEELSQDDKATLQSELEHKWSQTGALYFTGRHMTFQC